jgi:hypothetical protein
VWVNATSSPVRQGDEVPEIPFPGRKFKLNAKLADPGSLPGRPAVGSRLTVNEREGRTAALRAEREFQRKLERAAT